VTGISAEICCGGRGLARAEIRVARREPSNDAIVLGVLDAVERNPSVTQRSVARELGIALGLVNAYLNRCLSKGLIKIGQVPPRRYAYYLTPRGMTEKSRLTATYLMDSFSFFRQARMQCNELFQALAERGQRRLALVGGGDLAEIARLVARDHRIDIAGIAPASPEITALAANLESFGPLDAIVVTALEQSRETFAAAVELLGAERVYAPALLRVPPLTTTQPAERGNER
jgi:DNA-binding MarR family transcriptional regulator